MIHDTNQISTLKVSKNMPKRRRRRKTKQMTLDKFKIGTGLMILGGLYFFSRYLAKGSPVFEFMVNYARYGFGNVGLNVFFALCIIVGILIMIKGYLMRLLIKQFIIVMFLVSAVINFPIVDGDSMEYEAFGGYLSSPILLGLDYLFGGKAIAIKWMILILAALTIWRILFTFNFSLPKFNINLKHENKPARQKKEKKEKRYTQDSLISKKISEAKNAIKADPYEEKQSHKPTHPTATSQQPDAGSDSIMKNILKKKLEAKIQEKQQAEKPKQTIRFSSDKPTFSTSLMNSNLSKTTTIDEKFLMDKAKSLQNKLLEFNVPITIEGFDIGPSVVQIRIKPDAGIRVSTIEKLANDISLSLRTKSLRIIAPIAGTDSVGIQLPSPKPTMVCLGDILGSDEFTTASKKNTTNLALGKAIDGSNIVMPLEKMPHLLVAGATGSGKSVWVNDFILSLIQQNTPAELKFLMVDPKQVELELYSGLPYLLGPIVTDSDKALKLLKRAVEEMEERYSMLKKKRLKNLEEYNAKIIWEKMYRIVFVIDELADLMMSGNKKEVETCITRIAQKARAVGIHLIVATQRPSVNVITGLIKANIPTRIAYWVVSQIDSRTILDVKGAEDLVWKGDMLYKDPNTKFPIRIQCPFVDTPEIEKIIQTLKNKYMQWLSEDDIYHPEVVKTLENNLEVAGGWGGSGWADDELIEQAIQIIAQTRKASATLLQRKLNVGFARAARIMDALEERWVVWPQEWAKPRDIYM